MQIDESDEQNENAHISMRESLQPDSNVTLESAVHLLKQNSQRCSTDDGMQIDESDEQYKNACISICESLQPDSNVTFESALHELKQDSQRCTTDDGMQIDESDEHDENAESAIRESLQPDSNVTLESPVHPLKVRSQRCSIDDGMQADTKTGCLPQPDRNLTTSTHKPRPPKQTILRGQNHDRPSPGAHEISPSLISYATASTII
jgi:hypothetical protein